MKNNFVFRTAFMPSKKVISPSGKVSLTDSQFMADCDIETILKRCSCGDSSLVNPSKGIFADVTDYGDFARCMQKVAEAKMHFASLPAHIRSRFGDSPVALLNFLSDPANDSEAIRLGLKVGPIPTPTPTPTPAPTPTPTPTPTPKVESLKVVTPTA